MMGSEEPVQNGVQRRKSNLKIRGTKQKRKCNQTVPETLIFGMITLVGNSSGPININEIAPYLTNWVKFLSQGVKVGNFRPWVAVPEPTLKKKPGRPEDQDFKNTLRFLNV